MAETITLSSKQLHDYLQSFFADRKPHKVSEIREALALEGKQVSHGQLAGIIYRQAQSGALIRMGNGVYQLPAGASSAMAAEDTPAYLAAPTSLPPKPIDSRLLDCLRSSREALLSSLTDIRVLDVDNRTFELIGEIKAVMESMRSIEAKYKK